MFLACVCVWLIKNLFLMSMKSEYNNIRSSLLAIHPLRNKLVWMSSVRSKSGYKKWSDQDHPSPELCHTCPCFCSWKHTSVPESIHLSHRTAMYHKSFEPWLMLMRNWWAGTFVIYASKVHASLSPLSITNFVFYKFKWSTEVSDKEEGYSWFC
jgi:hypothetical protein